MRLSSILAGGALLLAVNYHDRHGCRNDRIHSFSRTTQSMKSPFRQNHHSRFHPPSRPASRKQDRAINAIVARTAPLPTDFDNTILPLENLSPILERVAAVFYHYMEALGTPEFAGCPEQAIPC